MPIILKGWKYAAFIGSIVGFIGIAIYPIIIEPMRNPEKYKAIQKKNRAVSLINADILLIHATINLFD